MEQHILDILNDLYELDPGLKEKEDELKKIIKELLSSKPVVEIDEEFKNKLKNELIEKLKTNKKKGFFAWFSSPKLTAVASIFSIAIAVVVVNNVFKPFDSFYGDMNLTGRIAERTTSGTTEIIQNEMNQEPNPVDTTSNNIDSRDSSNRQYPEEGENAPVTTSSTDENTITNWKGSGINPQGPPGQEGQIPYGDDYTEYFTFEDSPEPMMPLEIERSKDGEEDDGLLDIQTVITEHNTEEYARIYENPFLSAMTNPLSTFSIDVDTASYSNARRFIQSGQMPYPDVVRIEELINYFTYDYPEPEGEHPFSFSTEVSECPWNPENKLIHIGLQGRKISFEDLPPNNLVFLLDVSGSMESENKLPLLKGAFELLINELREVDRISIVVYAGAAGLVLPPTTCNNKETILTALNNLNAGGSTAGGEGIVLAYDTALKYFDPNGNNRIILATDGDFNVGASSDSEMIRLIEEKRNQGIFITVLGFGMGNYKDTKMESIADHGNGNYAYIDNLREAEKVLVTEMGGTLFTIAKDVKIQIEFNPVIVGSYRLIGYENRVLAKEDFDDDTKDAGELGAGHTVTVLYEIVLKSYERSNLDYLEPFEESEEQLKYQQSIITDDAYESNELLTIKFRYKQPDSDVSTLIEVPVMTSNTALENTSDNFRFSAAVAEWGMLLRDSEHKSNATYLQVLELARGAQGPDLKGYRAEFINLVESTRHMNNY